MKRVLFLLKDLTLGGTERVALNLIRHLPKDRFTCAIFLCGDTLSLSAEVPEGVEVMTGVSSQTRARKAFLPLLGKLRKRIRAFDIVIATNPDTTALMRIAGIGCSVRMLTWVHFSAAAFLPSVNRLIRLEAHASYPFVPERVFISEGSRVSFEEAFGATPSGRLIPNIFDPTAYSAASSTVDTVQSLKGQGLPVIGFVGRLAEEKGLPELLAIHEALLSKGVLHNLAIVGDGPLRGWLNSEIRNRQLQSRVHMLGADPAPFKAVQQFDLLALTSSQDAWPTVVLEAFEAGTPVVAYDCPTGPREMLVGELTEGLVPYGDSAGFVEAVCFALKNRESLAVAGHARIRSYYPEKIISQWTALLENP